MVVRTVDGVEVEYGVVCVEEEVVGGVEEYDASEPESIASACITTNMTAEVKANMAIACMLSFECV